MIKHAPAAAIAVAALVMGAPLAYGDPGSKVVVNGKAVGSGGNASCQHNSNPNNHPPDQIWIEMPHAQAQVTTDNQQVIGVTIEGQGSDGWMWSQTDQQQSGAATVTKTGNSYKLTGNATPYSNLEYRTSPSGPPVPFEIDATCS